MRSISSESSSLVKLLQKQRCTTTRFIELRRAQRLQRTGSEVQSSTLPPMNQSAYRVGIGRVVESSPSGAGCSDGRVIQECIPASAKMTSVARQRETECLYHPTLSITQSSWSQGNVDRDRESDDAPSDRRYLGRSGQQHYIDSAWGAGQKVYWYVYSQTPYTRY